MPKEKVYHWTAKATIKMIGKLAFSCHDIKKRRGSSLVNIGPLESVDTGGNVLFDLPKRFKGFLVQRAMDSMGKTMVDRFRHAVTVRGSPVIVGKIEDLIGANKENPDITVPEGYGTPFSEYGRKADGGSFETYWYELSVKDKEFEVEIESWAKGVTPKLVKKLCGFGYIGDRHGRLTIGRFELKDFKVTEKELVLG